MWRAGGDIELYLYAPYDQSEGFCDRPNYYCNFDKGHSVNRGAFVAQPGQVGWQVGFSYDKRGFVLLNGCLFHSVKLRLIF